MPLEDAKENAGRLTGLRIAHFFAGDVADICTDGSTWQARRNNYLTLPRAGICMKTAQQIPKNGGSKAVWA
jgi:tRNA/tmRNA/rRNA uracil-C5-methylase (TrmA/RlmC/RlmD family)